MGETLYRVKPAATVQITATGLALSICKQLTEADNEHIESADGSTFTALLPRSGGAAGGRD